MSDSVRKSWSSAGVFTDNKINKKCRRRNRKNNFKNLSSKVRQNYRKKFSGLKVSNSRNLYNLKRSQRAKTDKTSYSPEVMSNWYWSNYKKALEWQDKHKIAHWKAQALALQEENKYLIEIIRNMSSGMRPDVWVTNENLFQKRPQYRKYSKNNWTNESFEVYESDEESCDSSDLEFVVSEEMIQFFKQSYKHKMDLQKEKAEKEETKVENKVNEIQANRIKRWKEMNLLYGDQSSMIIGMETAVQLSFNKYCDTKSPKYWPNIPLKL